MIPREKKNNAYATFWKADKEYYGVVQSAYGGGGGGLQKSATV